MILQLPADAWTCTLTTSKKPIECHGHRSKIRSHHFFVFFVCMILRHNYLWPVLSLERGSTISCSIYDCWINNASCSFVLGEKLSMPVVKLNLICVSVWQILRGYFECLAAWRAARTSAVRAYGLWYARRSASNASCWRRNWDIFYNGSCRSLHDIRPVAWWIVPCPVLRWRRRLRCLGRCTVHRPRWTVTIDPMQFSRLRN